MQSSSVVTPLPAPRWDRNRVLFEIDDGDERVECAISREALQHLSDRRYGKPVELLASFVKVRRRIERVALSKHRLHPDPVSGLVIIWSGDLEDPDPVPAPDPSPATT